MSMRSWQKGACFFFFLFFVWHEIKQQSAVTAQCCSSVEKHNASSICLTAKRTHISIEIHLFQLSRPNYGWCFVLWGSCSSYSYRNNGIFFSRALNLNERLEVDHTTAVMSSQWYVCVCACVRTNCRYKIFMGRREMGKKLKARKKNTYLCCIFYWVSVQNQQCVFLLPEHLSD